MQSKLVSSCQRCHPTHTRVRNKSSAMLAYLVSQRLLQIDPGKDFLAPVRYN
jgi:hypothetical protein